MDDPIKELYSVFETVCTRTAIKKQVIYAVRLAVMGASRSEQSNVTPTITIADLARLPGFFTRKYIIEQMVYTCYLSALSSFLEDVQPDIDEDDASRLYEMVNETRSGLAEDIVTECKTLYPNVKADDALLSKFCGNDQQTIIRMAGEYEWEQMNASTSTMH